MQQNNYAEFSGCFFYKFKVKMAPRPPPRDPRTGFVPVFPGLPTGHRPCFRLMHPGQASGPPRPGAGVGVGMLRRCHNVSWKSQRVKKMIVQKCKDSTPIQNYSKICNSFKRLFDLVGFTSVWRSSTIIQDLLRCFHPVFHFYLKRSRLKIVLDPPEILNNKMQHNVQNVDVW